VPPGEKRALNTDAAGAIRELLGARAPEGRRGRNVERRNAARVETVDLLDPEDVTLTELVPLARGDGANSS